MSTSESDDSECLKEALDSELFPNELYKPKKNEVQVKEKVSKLPPSLRKQNDLSASFNPLQIKATPEFRQYVSKHLAKTLNKVIYYEEVLPQIKKQKTNISSGGVKLLKNSKYFLNEVHNESNATVKNAMKPLKRKSRYSSDSDEEEKVKEAAVTAEWILSGKETEFWAPSTKGELEVITVKAKPT